MIAIKYTDTSVLLTVGSHTLKVKPVPGTSPAHLEDAISQVFKKAAISHKVRDFAVLQYPAATKIYLDREGSTVSLESECGTIVEMTGSLLGLKALLEAANVPCET